MAARFATALLIGACCALLYAFGSIGIGTLAAQNGRDRQADVRFGAFGIEPVCAPGSEGRIDGNGLTWCRLRGGATP